MAPLLCHLLRLALLSLAVGRISEARPFSWDRIKYVYAFGDSYSFVQGTRGLANFRSVAFPFFEIGYLAERSSRSFIGDKLHLAFAPQELLTNHIVPRNVRFQLHTVCLKLKMNPEYRRARKALTG